MMSSFETFVGCEKKQNKKNPKFSVKKKILFSKILATSISSMFLGKFTRDLVQETEHLHTG